MSVALLRSSILAVLLPGLPLLAQTAEFAFADLAHHYATVEAELRRAPLPSNPQIAVRRLQTIELLHEYRMRGNFGDDASGSGSRNALFVDADGRRCAVAFLLDRTGRSDLTNAIAELRNDAWIVELASDPELRDWLQSQGLTVAEAARIQGPSWGPILQELSESLERARLERLAAETKPEGRPAYWRAPDRDRPTNPRPIGSGAGRPSAPTSGVAQRGGGTQATTLTAPEWIQWWEWNRDRFETPNQVAEEDSANTRARAISRDQAIEVLRELAANAQADVRAAANQALGRMLALNEADEKAHDATVREVRLRALSTAACTPKLKELHQFAKETLPALDGEEALVALAACACSTNDAFLGMLEPRLLEAFEATSPDTVAAAALAAANGSKPRLRELARQIVREDGVAWRRSLLVAALAKDASTDDVAALTVALGARSPSVRRAAAIALGRSRAELSLPALLTAYELEHEQGVKGMVLLAIGDLGGDVAADFLRKELADGPRALRVLAAIGLGLLARQHEEDDETVNLAAAMRADHNHDHAGGYLLALGLTGDARALPILHTELHGGATSSARGAAAGALGLLRDPASLPELTLAAEQDSCPWVRGQCAAALGRIGDGATDTLRNLLQTEANVDVRRAAAVALGDVGSPRAAAGLVAAARDSEASPVALVGVAIGLGRQFRLTEPQLPMVRSAMDPQAMPALIAWVAGQDL